MNQPAFANSCSENKLCKHCGRALSSPNSAFCCTGCDYIYHTIEGLGLQEFYHYRDARRQGQVASPRHDSYAYLDHAEFQRLHVRDSSPMKVVTLFLEGIHCAGCIWLLEKLPTVVGGVQSCRVRFVQGEIVLTYDPHRVRLSEIAQTLDSLGYIPHAMTQSERSKIQSQDDRKLLIRLGVAGFCSANIMMLAVSLWQGMWTGIDQDIADYLRWTSLGLSLPALCYSAQPFYRAAWGALRQGRLHIDLTISIAILAAFIVSFWNTVRRDLHVYYDSAALLIFLLLLARWIHLRAVRRAQHVVRDAWALLPERVIVQGEDRETTEIPLEALEPGMRIIIRSHERVPADGIIQSGDSTFDCSIITGEARPIRMVAGDSVEAGVLNHESTIVVKVTACGKDTRVGRLVQCLDEPAAKPDFVHFTEKVSQYFVWIVMALAVLTLLYWGQTVGYEVGLRNAITLLIVSCPCALAIATPLCFTLAGARAARRGILIRDEGSIERLAAVRNIFFDKTGTLTSGHPVLVKRMILAPEKLNENCAFQLAAAGCNHPLAKVIRDELEGEGSGTNATTATLSCRHHAGRGVSGVSSANETWRLGSLAWLFSEGIPAPEKFSTMIAGWLREGISVVGLSRDEQLVGVFGLRDMVKPQAPAVIAALRHAGVNCFLLSGDMPEVVSKVGQEVGIPADHIHASLLPEDKQRMVSECASVSVMVGDGVNDAEALKTASVGIGVRSAMSVNIEVADIFLTQDCPENVLTVYQGARHTMRAIRRALSISVLYNTIGAGLAMGGFINPLIAALLMPLSSLSAIAVVTFSSMFEDPMGDVHQTG